MRAREQNPWAIRCHRTWTRELAVSCPSTNSTCWRWNIITSQLLMLLIRWTSRTTEWTFMTHCPSLLKTFLLRLQVRRRYYVERGFSVCGLLTAVPRNRMTKS